MRELGTSLKTQAPPPQSECSCFPDVLLLCLTSVCVAVRSCMVEESGTLESQLEATKVKPAENVALLPGVGAEAGNEACS